MRAAVLCAYNAPLEIDEVSHGILDEHSVRVRVVAAGDCHSDLQAAKGDVWAAPHAAELGGDPDQLVVMGDSAGGALAALTAVRARDEGGPCLTLRDLVYPMIDPELKTPSSLEFADGYLTSTPFLDSGRKAYIAGRRGQPSTAPSLVSDLRGLPPAIVVTTGHDPLRDEGVDYIGRLEASGIDVEARHYAGQIHGFAFMPAVIPEADAALAELALLVRKALNSRGRA